MGERIYIREQGNLKELDEKPFDSEDTLQKLIADHPELLDGKQMRPDDPRRWLLVKREQGISETSDGGSRWALDHLLVDQDAIPTLVEVKRGKSPEIRRKVVGQILEYAAHAARTWKAEQLREAFERTSDEPDEALRALLQEEELDADKFWDDVATNLAAKKLRLLFVADELPDELVRVVEFLNEQMASIEVLAVEVKQFMNESNQTLVPRVMGQHTKPRNSASSSRRIVSKEEFLESCDEHGKVVFSRILELAQQKSMSISWGEKGFSLGVDINGTRVVFSAGYPPGGASKEQYFRTWFYGKRGAESKIAVSDETTKIFRQEALATGLFKPGQGQELRCDVNSEIAVRVDDLAGWCESVQQKIKEYGLKRSHSSLP